MLHYIGSIRSLGSADGYNTESPERLHIDYAKEAYRASNRRDYVAQMAKWLQRQEAVDRQSAYLEWVSTTPTNSRSMQDSEDGPFTPSGIKPGHAYCLAKTCPFPDIPVTDIMSAFGALDFVPACQTFLSKHMPNAGISVSIHDHFNVYKSIMIRLPSVPHISDQNRLNKLRACCALSSCSPPNPREPDTPAHFDTALIVENLPLHLEAGGLSGWLH
jgi:hypothetical protein